MTSSLSVPEASWVDQDMILSGLNYQFIYSLNERDNRLRLDIYREGNPVILGIKIMENQFLLKNYSLNIDWDLYCYRAKKTDNPVTLGNIGIGKEYELLHFTKEDLEALNG